MPYSTKGKYFHHKLKDSKSFNPNSFRTVSIYQTNYKGKKYRKPGTKAIVGYNLFSKRREVVSILEPKK